jgi:hypothetical protein
MSIRSEFSSKEHLHLSGLAHDESNKDAAMAAKTNFFIFYYFNCSRVYQCLKGSTNLGRIKGKSKVFLYNFAIELWTI